MPDSSEVIYSDFDNQFITNPITKSLNKKTNRDAVKQAVKNLILTDFYERLFNTDIGCSIRGYLFGPFYCVSTRTDKTSNYKCTQL